MNRAPLKIVSIIALILLISIPFLERLEIPGVGDLLVILAIAFIAIVFMFVNVVVNSGAQMQRGF